MIESELALWVFKNIGKTLISEGMKRLLPKSAGDKLENLAKENKKDEFIDKLEDILSVNEDIKNRLFELQQSDLKQATKTKQIFHGDGSIGSVNGSVYQHFHNNQQDHEKYYDKALLEIQHCSCTDAIDYLEKYKNESTNIKDTKLLIIACEIYSNKLTNEKVKDYIPYLNTLDNNYFALLLLGLIHIEYCQPKCKRIDGLKTEDIAKKLKSISKENKYDNIINCIIKSCSIKAKQTLSL